MRVRGEQQINGRVLLALGVFGAGILFGVVAHREVSKERHPPVRVRFPLDISRESYDGLDERVYALSVAAQIEARFHRDDVGPYRRDLEVTVVPRPCWPGRKCDGVWQLEVRTKSPLSRESVSVAIGQGKLTVRPVQGASGAACERPVFEPDTQTVTAPLIAGSVSDRGCWRLGPVVRTLADASVSDASASTGVVVAPADAAELARWSKSHPEGELGVVLDGRIIARVPSRDVVDLNNARVSAAKSDIDKPVELPLIDFDDHDVNSAIEVAIELAAPSIPFLGDPTNA